MKISPSVKPGIIGAVVGAAVITIIGFAGGIVTTDGAANDRAEKHANAAVVSALTPICVMQFRAQPNAETTMVELEGARSYGSTRTDMLIKTGAATMPGSEEPDAAVAKACVEVLLASAKKASDT